MRGWTGIAAVLAAVFVAGTAMAGRLEAVRLQGLSVLAGPRDGSGLVRVLRAGETVTVLGRNGHWVEVALADGTKGFVQGGFLTGFDDIPPVPAYAKRMDPTVTRPSQSAGPSVKTAAVDPRPATAPKPEKPAAAMPAPRPVSPEAVPYTPVADAGGLDGLLGCFVPQAAGLKEKTPPGDFNARKNRYVIEVHLGEHRLYLYENLPDGTRRLVHAYVVAVPGRDMEAPHGWGVVTGISFEPTWVPTQAMRVRARKKGKTLPPFVKPGVKANPMGSFKIILSHGNGYRIHGNNNPGSIGRSVTSGCIRMRNAEGKDMAQMIDVGTEVVFFDK